MLMQVVYRPSSSPTSGSSSGGSYRPQGNYNYRSRQDTTQSVRKWSGFVSTVGIFFIGVVTSQFITTALVGAGSVGYVVLMVIGVGSVVATTVLVFKAWHQRRVAVVLLPLGLLLLSSVSPGLPALIALIYVAGSCLYLVYVVASKVVQTRAFALAIVALPLIGGMYYVPALFNFPHQVTLQIGRVFRSVSLDERQIEQNIGRWSNSTVVDPNQVAVLNGLPQSAAQLQRVLPGESWNQWQGFHRRFEEATPQQLRRDPAGPGVTKAAFVDALQHKQSVVMVVAHSDGFSIHLPNGETVGVGDLEQVKETVRSNHPRVFLFSCETARLNDVQSFAKVLLDYGADAVAAPVTRVTASEALDVFRSFLTFAVSESPLPVNQAFEKALLETGRRMMEVWVAKAFTAADKGQQLG